MLTRISRFLGSIALAYSTLAVCWSTSAKAVLAPPATTFLLPLTCAELMPDMGPYLQFFEAVARGNVQTDKQLSKRIFRLLSLRERISAAADRAREQNPVDQLIRKTLCFYREQKEPISPIPYDKPQFLAFLRDSMKSLEEKVDDAIFQYEFEKYQRREYQRQLERNQGVVDKLRQQADLDADRTFERLSETAKKKVRAQ